MSALMIFFQLKYFTDLRMVNPRLLCWGTLHLLRCGLRSLAFIQFLPYQPSLGCLIPSRALTA